MPLAEVQRLQSPGQVEASIGRYKRVIGDTLQSRSDENEATEAAIAATALNRMLEFGRPSYARIA